MRSNKTVLKILGVVCERVINEGLYTTVVSPLRSCLIISIHQINYSVHSTARSFNSLFLRGVQKGDRVVWLVGWSQQYCEAPTD